MQRPAGTALGLSILAVGLSSCGLDPQPDAAFRDPGTAGAGPELSLRFEVEPPLMLGPRESRRVGVFADPPGDHWVRFALLGDGDGTPGDASLDDTDRRTDLTGRAEVTLTAPSVPATFLLRASVGTVTNSLLVAVDASGLASLTVVPVYSGGRAVSTWFASVHDNATCADVEGTPPTDGPFHATAEHDMRPLVDGVPAGVPLAVTLRAGQFAGGCAPLQGAIEGEENLVSVTVLNRPIQLSQSRVELVFGADGPNAEARALFESVIENAVTEVFNPTESTDVETLLDAMQATLTGAERTAFRSARGAAAWDSRLTAALGDASPDFLRAPLVRWLGLGLEAGRDDLVEATIEAVPGETEEASVLLTRVADGEPEVAGFQTEFDAMWQADAADQVLIGTDFTFSAPALLVALARRPATSEVPASMGVEDALSSLAPCSQIAEVLVEFGQANGVSYAGCDNACRCDLACTIALCEGGIASIVQGIAALDANATSSGQIAATGHAIVGENAELAGLDGSWVGNLDIGGGTAQLTGSLRSRAE
jgi:hypothetical protein